MPLIEAGAWKCKTGERGGPVVKGGEEAGDGVGTFSIPSQDETIS